MRFANTEEEYSKLLSKIMGYVDLYGNPVERPRNTHPYSYDEYVIKKLNWTKTDEVVYSDRLRLWYDNYRELQKECFGRVTDHYSQMDTSEIEKFLCALFGRDIELTAVTECCNVSNGNPINLFYFRDKE